MIRTVTSRVRRAIRTATDAIRSTVAPAALVRSRTAETAPDPADVFTPEEMPAPEVIEAAAVDVVQLPAATEAAPASLAA
ncbi:hypothetical protein SUDANB58_05776 (plasmid) [Streptomyces sp. enrichment culture]|uniref:hypothetical protein n=1 Tax=Streptomyces sp. enrichment culture TaxID=1795815 RepID=UPI003F55F1B0